MLICREGLMGGNCCLRFNSFILLDFLPRAFDNTQSYLRILVELAQFAIDLLACG